MKLRNLMQLRSGMMFNTIHSGGASVDYMIISNDLKPGTANWAENSRWIVIWFSNTKADANFPGLSWHSKHNEAPYNLLDMWDWIGDDEMVYYIDRELSDELCAIGSEKL